MQFVKRIVLMFRREKILYVEKNLHAKLEIVSIDLTRILLAQWLYLQWSRPKSRDA
jgi:hypothetical protein